MSSAKYIKKVDYGEPFHFHFDQESSSKLSFSRRHSRREKCLFAALLVFVIVAIVFAVLYAVQVSKKPAKPGSSSASSEGTTHAPNTNKSGPPATSVCMEPLCVLIASGKLGVVLSFRGTPGVKNHIYTAHPHDSIVGSFIDSFHPGREPGRTSHLKLTGALISMWQNYFIRTCSV